MIKMVSILFQGIYLNFHFEERKIGKYQLPQIATYSFILLEKEEGMIIRFTQCGYSGDGKYLFFFLSEMRVAQFAFSQCQKLSWLPV